jgi:hypothetical protein
MKRFLIPALIVLIIALIAGYFIWNKPHRKAEDEAGIAITAEALYNAYKTDEKAANALYLNKVIEVSGELASQEKNQDGQPVAILRGEAGDDLLAGGIMCTMREKDVRIPAGGPMRIKGICTGFANDVHLTDCILNK